MTVAEWHDASLALRARGLDALANFYADNALRLTRGEQPIWPPPAELKASTLLAEKPASEPFADDAREL